MKQYLGFTKHFFLLATPVIASTLLASSPSQAATFSLSEAALLFTNFSQNPLNVSTDTDTNTVTVANGGRVSADANADAFFAPPPPVAGNLSRSTAEGENKDYIGESKSFAEVTGDFLVEAGKALSFNFEAFLNLDTSTDALPYENATANGDIYFELWDTTNNSLLDFFRLAGNLNTQGVGDFLTVTSSSNNVTYNTPVFDVPLGDNEESANAAVRGSYLRTFDKQTNVRLKEVKRNYARVTAPEPSTALALVFFSALVAIANKRKRQARILPF